MCIRTLPENGLWLAYNWVVFSIFINAPQAILWWQNIAFNVAHSLISIHEPLKRIQGLMVKLCDFYSKKKYFSEFSRPFQGSCKSTIIGYTVYMRQIHHVNCESWERTILMASLPVNPKSIHFQLYGLALVQNSCDLKVSSQVCTIITIPFLEMLGGGSGGGDGLLVSQLDSASIGPKWSPS